MNVVIWILQIMLALICLGSGIFKTVFPEKKLVESGQTGVEGLHPLLIKFIGISEILLALGLVLPWYTGILPVLTPVSGALFAMIMLLAGNVHYKRYKNFNHKKERQNVINNIIFFVLALVVSGYRASELA